MIPWQVWLILSGFFFVLEIATVGFLVFWFGVAALITCLLSLVIPNVIVQTAIFVILSAALIFFTRPLSKKLTQKDNTVTNANSIIGKEAIVTKDIKSTSNGQIKINGDLWTAVLEDNTYSVVPKESTVEILKIDGVKVVVHPVKIKEVQKVD